MEEFNETEELKRIHNLQFEMMNDILSALEKENVPYYLAYGTLLGAVRHKGFIPWDDDVDIQILHKDYNKFIRVCRKELDNNKYYFSSCFSRGDYKLYSKLRLKGTFVPTLYNEDNQKINGEEGIWIDFFHVVNASNSESLLSLQLKLLRVLQIIKTRYLSEAGGFLKKTIKRIYNTLIFIGSKIVFEMVIILGNNNAKECINCGAGFYNNPSADYLRKHGTILPKKVFEQINKYVFKDSSFYGPANYDLYLTCCYSADYMSPKRYRQHITDFAKVEGL